jgi:retron-type reverse transcriptase
MSRVSELKNFNDIADYLDITTGYLYKILFQEKNYLYKSFSIPKKNGGFREIHQPSRRLMHFQVKIKEMLERSFNPHSKAHGFVKERDFITNASNHVNRKFVLNIDLEDFFNSISFSRVRQMFIGYFKVNDKVSTTLAHLCCHPNGFLPQGAPTSPIISNIILKTFDKQITELVKSNGKTYYTRYADDITISSNNFEFPAGIATINSDNSVTLSDKLMDLVQQNGFKINSNKTRLQNKGQSQRVTGLTVNKKLNIDRRYIKNIRAILNNFDNTTAVDTEIEKFQEKNREHGRSFNNIVGVFSALKGRIQHIAHVRGYSDPVFQKLARYFNEVVNSKDIKVALIPDDNSNELLYNNVFVIDPGDEFCRFINDEHSFDETLYSQGTAFYLKDIGLITNYHVVKDLVEDVISKGYKFCKNYYIRYYSRTSSFSNNAKIIYYDKQADLAILEPEDNSVLQSGFIHNSAIRSNIKIKLVGFPEYREGDKLRVEEGTILRQVNYNGLIRYEISPLIFGGNSGGPILNKHNQVIGVAVRGLTTNGVVPPQIIPIQQVIELFNKNYKAQSVRVLV